MTEQQKILRVLKLISLLKGRGRSVDQISQILETSSRTIYRYFHLLEDVGFIIDKDFEGRYFIHSEENDEVSVFSHEEAGLLKNLIESAGKATDILKESIVKKLYLQSELPPLTDSFHNARLSQMVGNLSKAISEQTSVVLKNYHSANSDSILDRTIEPIAFKANLKTLDAFDVDKMAMRSFKVDRIGEVEMLRKPFKHADLHTQQLHDIFGVSGNLTEEVSIRLSFRANLLLREEYPQSIPFIQQLDNGSYKFVAKVNGYSGVGRFVLGLLDQIQVSGPEEFKTYIRDKISTQIDQLA